MGQVPHGSHLQNSDTLYAFFNPEAYLVVLLLTIVGVDANKAYDILTLLRFK